MITDICPNDPEILGGGDIEWYVASGRSGLTCIETALKAARETPEQMTEILDLPLWIWPRAPTS